MPGLSFIYEMQGDLRKDSSDVVKALDAMMHTDQYERRILLDKNSHVLACTKYAGYPIDVFESDRFFICLEGRLHGKSHMAVQRELNDLAAIIFGPPDEARDPLLQWLKVTDGEFVVFILDKASNEIAILNDVLGLLPLYYYKSDRTFLISREQQFIVNLTDSRKLDRLAVAQYLLLCYTLGTRTLIRDICRLEPATLVRIRLNSFSVDIASLFKYNFDERKYAGVALRDNAYNLVQLFNEACGGANSNGSRLNVLSLSGGMDSRAVGAGLRNNNIAVEAATFLTSDHLTEADADVAERVTSALHIGWKLFRPAPPTGKDCLRLLNMKYGMNYLSMSFIMPFLNELKETYGTGITLFTGDVGMPPLGNNCPSRKIEDLDDLVEYILLNGREAFAFDDVVKLTGVDRDEMKGAVKELLLSYPEESLMQKYVHFKIYERYMHFSFEGIDRNRFFFWVETPLLENRFLQYALNCPDEQKVNKKLYRQFFLGLSPRLAGIDYANYMLPITSKRLQFALFLKHHLNKMAPGAVKIIRSRAGQKWKPYGAGSGIMGCLRDQLANCRAISHYLNIPENEGIIGTCRKTHFGALFTVTSLMEQLECSRSSLEKYSESEL